MIVIHTTDPIAQVLMDPQEMQLYIDYWIEAFDFSIDVQLIIENPEFSIVLRICHNEWYSTIFNVHGC